MQYNAILCNDRDSGGFTTISGIIKILCKANYSYSLITGTSLPIT